MSASKNNTEFKDIISVILGEIDFDLCKQPVEFVIQSLNFDKTIFNKKQN